MAFHILRENIVRVQADALVCPTNPLPRIGGGAEQEMHRVAGPELLAARQELGELAPGQAVIVPAFGLPAKWVILAVTPVWDKEASGERERALLASLYQNILRLAAEKGCSSFATPLLGAGANGWHAREALQLAKTALADAPEAQALPMDITLVVFDLLACKAAKRLWPALPSRIDEAEVKERIDHEYWEDRQQVLRGGKGDEAKLSDVQELPEKPRTFMEAVQAELVRRGWVDADVYNRACVTRQTYSRLLCDPKSKPSKKIAIRLCMGLRLELPEAERLLALADHALSPDRPEDAIVRHFFEKGKYDVMELKAVLDDLADQQGKM